MSNITQTQSIDERCAELAEVARQHARFMTQANTMPEDFDFVSGCADRIIALRTAEAAQEVQS